jgi:hypothetical protein
MIPPPIDKRQYRARRERVRAPICDSSRHARIARRPSLPAALFGSRSRCEDPIAVEAPRRFRARPCIRPDPRSASTGPQGRLRCRSAILDRRCVRIRKIRGQLVQIPIDRVVLIQEPDLTTAQVLSMRAQIQHGENCIPNDQGPSGARKRSSHVAGCGCQLSRNCVYASATCCIMPSRASRRASVVRR